jgi:hypothetical protein
VDWVGFNLIFTQWKITNLICSFDRIRRIYICGVEALPSSEVRMLLAPIGQSILGGDNSVPTNRLPYNSRQRKPSTDSDSSSAADSPDGPAADEYKFVETSHPQEVK